jgi:hypothetical protein
MTNGWTTTSVGPNQEEPQRFPRAGMRPLAADTTEQPLNPREEVLLKALRMAVANGWEGWKTHVNDAVTVGQEAEGVLRDYRKGQKPIEPLIFDHDFAHFVGYDLIGLVLSTDRLRYLKEVL